MNAGVLSEAEAYAKAYGGAGIVIRHGHVVAAWGDQKLRYDLKSTTKSIGATALGLGISDGRLSLGHRAASLLPEFGTPPSVNSSTGWLPDITLLHLATHTAGFEKTAGYGGLLRAPGTAWQYSDGGFNWLADVLTSVYGEDLNSLLFRRVFSRIGITASDLVWRSHANREQTLHGIQRREFGSGIRASVDAMARIGYLYLRGGSWRGEAILPSSFIDTVRQPSPAAVDLPVAGSTYPPDSARHYGIAWFTNSDGSIPDVPRDAFWAWGLLDSLIVVIPSLDIVAARAGGTLGGGTGWNADYDVIAPFIAPIARAAVQGSSTVAAPDLVGLARADAEALLAAVGLVAGEVTSRPDASMPAGHVVSQDPVSGTLLTTGSDVAFVVSSGDAAAIVPLVTGLALSAATSELQAASLQAGTVTEVADPSVPAGHVISQEPVAGTQVASGSSITLVVSTGAAQPTAWPSFDGANDVASVPSSASLKPASAVSVEARIRPRTIAANKLQDRILRKGVDYELMISTNSTGCAGTTRGSLQFSVTIAGTARKVCGGSLAMNAWQHVAGVYDGRELALYVNGSRVAATPAAGTVKRSSTLITIGNIKLLTRPFDGDIVEVAVWSRALTASEWPLRAAQPPSGTEPDLAAYWPLREGDGQALRDATSHANHGRRGLTTSAEDSDPSWSR